MVVIHLTFTHAARPRTAEHKCSPAPAKRGVGSAASSPRCPPKSDNLSEVLHFPPRSNGNREAPRCSNGSRETGWSLVRSYATLKHLVLGGGLGKRLRPKAYKPHALERDPRSTLCSIGSREATWQAPSSRGVFSLLLQADPQEYITIRLYHCMII